MCEQYKTRVYVPAPVLALTLQHRSVLVLVVVVAVVVVAAVVVDLLMVGLETTQAIKQVTHYTLAQHDAASGST